jgi:hypothetical protein
MPLPQHVLMGVVMRSVIPANALPLKFQSHTKIRDLAVSNGILGFYFVLLIQVSDERLPGHFASPILCVSLEPPAWATGAIFVPKQLNRDSRNRQQKTDKDCDKGTHGLKGVTLNSFH